MADTVPDTSTVPHRASQWPRLTIAIAPRASQPSLADPRHLSRPPPPPLPRRPPRLDSGVRCGSPMPASLAGWRWSARHRRWWSAGRARYTQGRHATPPSTREVPREVPARCPHRQAVSTATQPSTACAPASTAGAPRPAPARQARQPSAPRRPKSRARSGLIACAHTE